MDVEIYILNIEQMNWFIERYNRPVETIVVISNVSGYKCIEKSYLNLPGLDDVINYISEQNIPITIVNVIDDINIQIK